MDPLDLITDPTLHSYAIIALTATSLAMPLLEWVANRTATDLDNRAVALLARVLSFVPRVRLGNTKLSAATVARTSKMPPPITPIACVFLLLGCAGYEHAPDDARAAASRMRADLAEVRGYLQGAGPAVDLLCAVKPGDECDAARDTLSVLEAAHKAASQAVDVIDATGIAAQTVQPQVSHVLDQARALGETIEGLAKEVQHAVVSREPAGAPVEPLLESSPESAGEPAQPAVSPAP